MAKGTNERKMLKMAPLMIEAQKMLLAWENNDAKFANFGAL